jgi:hypothetical protein
MPKSGDRPSVPVAFELVSGAIDGSRHSLGAFRPPVFRTLELLFTAIDRSGRQVVSLLASFVPCITRHR